MFRAGKLTTLERQKLAGYLMHRSRLESKLPSAHPYRYVTP